MPQFHSQTCFLKFDLLDKCPRGLGLAFLTVFGLARWADPGDPGYLFFVDWGDGGFR